MCRINIGGIKLSYEVIDCDNKLVVIKAPYTTMIYGDLLNTLLELRKYFMNECNAKEVIVTCDNIDYETLDIKDALTIVNKRISELFTLKEKLLEDMNNENS